MSEKNMSQKVESKIESVLTEIQKVKIFNLVRYVSKNTCERVCPEILDMLLNSEKGKLKSNLGKSIFHLQRVERLNSTIGLERLIEAGLLVDTVGLLKILESSEQDAKDLASEMREIL